ETFGGRRGSTIRLRIRLGSYSMDFAANTALPNCAGARGSPKASITAGRRNSSRPASGGLLGIPPLPLVRSLPIWRSRSAGRSTFTPKPGVEPHARCGEGEDCQAGPRRADFVASGAVSTLYRQRKVLCLRGVGLSPVQGP